MTFTENIHLSMLEAIEALVNRLDKLIVYIEFGFEFVFTDETERTTDDFNRSRNLTGQLDFKRENVLGVGFVAAWLGLEEEGVVEEDELFYPIIPNRLHSKVV